MEAGASSSGWATVKSKNGSLKEPPQKGPSDTLQPDGWNVPVLRVVEMEDVKISSCGVALVSMGVGKRLVMDGFAVEGCLGLLLPSPVVGKDDAGTLMSVVVQDQHGKLQVRQRYLYQLGPQPVVMTSSAPKVDLKDDSAKVLLLVDKKHVSSEVWNSVLNRPVPAARA